METNWNFKDNRLGQGVGLFNTSRELNIKRQIWAIGGGKGGVGKSLVSSSLAFTLAKMGYPTVAIDLDLGGANLHTVLGIQPPKRCISDLLNGKVNQLSECLTDSPYPNLKVVAGAKDDLKITEIPDEHIKALLYQIHHLNAQFIILDLGAGTNRYTLEFFNAADVGILTTLPEPTSIENAYRFLKSSYYHYLRSQPHLESIHHLIDAAMTPGNTAGIQNPTDLVNVTRFHSPEAFERLKADIQTYRPRLILNQTRSQSDVDIGFSMKSVSKKYFGIEVDFLGSLEYEPNIWQSVRKMRPILADFPQSRIAVIMERICNHLIKQARIDSNLHEPRY